MKVESLCVLRRAYVKIYLWGSDAKDTKTGTILDVAEEYLVNVGDMTLWTSFVSFPSDGESLWHFTGTLISLYVQSGWMASTTYSACVPSLAFFTSVTRHLEDNFSSTTFFSCREGFFGQSMP